MAIPYHIIEDLYMYTVVRVRRSGLLVALGLAQAR